MNFTNVCRAHTPSGRRNTTLLRPDEKKCHARSISCVCSWISPAVAAMIRFERMDGFPPPDFKSGAFDRSATSPYKLSTCILDMVTRDRIYSFKSSSDRPGLWVRCGSVAGESSSEEPWYSWVLVYSLLGESLCFSSCCAADRVVACLAVSSPPTIQNLP